MTTTDTNIESGFTLVELLLAIVLVGILVAVAVVGINGVRSDASDASCQATLDAVRTAVAVHHANQNPHVYPTSFSDMTATGELVLPASISFDPAQPTTIGANGWTIALAADGSGIVNASGSAKCN